MKPYMYAMRNDQHSTISTTNDSIMNEIDLMSALEQPEQVDDMMRPLKASWLMTAHAFNHTVMDVTDGRMSQQLFQDGAFFTPLSKRSIYICSSFIIIE